MSESKPHLDLSGLWLLSEDRIKTLAARVSRMPKRSTEDVAGNGKGKRFSIASGVAVVPVVGILTKYPMPEEWMDDYCGTTPAQCIMETLAEVMANDEVLSVVMLIDSPGGMVAGTSELIDALKGYRAKQPNKPIRAIVSDQAASGGYYIASQCVSIACNPLGEVGCIGVYCVLADDSEFWTAQGINFTLVSSGGVKGLGVDGKVTQELIDDQRRGVMAIYDRFIADVSAGRSISLEQAKTLGDGRMWIASEALNMRLIDSVASVGDAMAAIQMETYKMTLESFNSFAAEHPEAVASFVEQGKKSGMAEGAKQERDRVGSVLKAYGLDSHPACASIAKGDDADTAQRIADVAAKARADAEASAASAAATHKAETERLAKELEKAKFEGSGQKPMGSRPAASGTTTTGDGTGLSPKDQAEREWDNDPSTHAGTTRENYVAYRKAEIAGSHRSFEREPAKST